MLRHGRMPDWLYQTLPYLYFGAGLLTLLAMANWMAAVSGALLMSAGVIVWLQRRKYRRYRHVTVSADDHGLVVGDGNRSGNLVHLTWRTEFDCGHPVIDAQHRGLLEVGNALLNAILEKQDKLDVELMLDDLILDIGYHFRDEEAILARMQHPILEEHKKLHRQLLMQAQALSKRYQRGELAAGDLLDFIADDIVARHIVQEDRRFFVTGMPGKE